jgi:hypothetical protein
MVKTKDVVVKVSQELDEVMLLIKEVVLTVRKGGDVTSLLPSLVKAIDGAGDIPTELHDALPAALASVSVRTAEIAAALIAPKIVPVVG